MDDTSPLQADRVYAILRYCLYEEDESTVGHIPVEGITIKVGLHPERLASRREEIIAMLMELPDKFHEKKGGGAIFVEACNDRHGRQWTSFQKHMDELFVLGKAVGRVVQLMTREEYILTPLGVPYFTVTEEETEITVRSLESQLNIRIR